MPAQAPKIAVLVWSLYGHIAKLTEEVVAGLKENGAEVEIFQVSRARYHVSSPPSTHSLAPSLLLSQFAETLPDEVITKMHGNKAPIASYPVVKPDDLTRFDGFVMGFPTRYVSAE